MVEKQDESLCQDFEEDRPIAAAPTLRLSDPRLSAYFERLVAIAASSDGEPNAEQLELNFDSSPDDTPR